MAARERLTPAVKETVTINKPTDIIERKVTLCGLSDVMFDRYPGDNNTKLDPWQKLYLKPGAEKVIGIPALNIMSALTSHNNSFPKRLRDSRQYKNICNACLSFAHIGPTFIPFTRNGEIIVFGQMKDDIDELSGIYVHYSTARLEKGIPNPKARPVLPIPWELSFNFTLFPNKEIKEQEIINLLEDGGRAVGIGTYRGVFGKFYISKWE